MVYGNSSLVVLYSLKLGCFIKCMPSYPFKFLTTMSKVKMILCVCTNASKEMTTVKTKLHAYKIIVKAVLVNHSFRSSPCFILYVCVRLISIIFSVFDVCESGSCNCTSFDKMVDINICKETYYVVLLILF